MGYSTCNYTAEIDENECIGDSLQTINANFSALEIPVCNLVSDVNDLEDVIDGLLGGVSNLMNIRMSLSNSTAITTTDIANAGTLYIHPYNGTAVALYNTTTSKWELKQFTSILSVSLASLAANTNYDIYLYYSSGNFQVDFVAWSSQAAGATPPTTGTQNGVLVRTGQPNKRLIGCLRTTNAGQTEVSFGRTSAVSGSYPKIYVWNLYNQQPTSFSILETGTSISGINRWTSTTNGDNANNNGPFEPFGGVNNKIGFICRSPLVTTLNSILFIEYDFCTYYTYSLDLETPTVAELLAKTPGVPIFESCSSGALTQAYTNTIPAGYHYIQKVSMTYQNQFQRYLVWTGDRHSYGTIGTLAAF